LHEEAARENGNGGVVRRGTAGDRVRPLSIASGAAAGTAPENRPMSDFSRVLATCVAIALALIGLLMTTCGGMFTIMGIKEHGILVLSIPSVLIGVGLIVGAAKILSSKDRRG
jgi:hypothetical protein